ncbi:MAG: hypothetical protein ACJAR4_001347 [Psychroserpens sp.]|jgi:hypothetical protein
MNKQSRVQRSLQIEILKEAAQSTNHVNVYIIVATNSSAAYQEGLGLLSTARLFIYNNPIFSSNSQQLSEGLEKMTLVSYNRPLEVQSQLWRSLGTFYQPSLVYKVHLIFGVQK